MEQINKENETHHTVFAQTYFHGTKADLKLGDFIKAGYNSNFGLRKNAKYIFLTATLDLLSGVPSLLLEKDVEEFTLLSQREKSRTTRT